MGKPWIYITQKGTRGMPSRPPRIKDLGEHSIEIFIRELIQNSLDARYDSSKPVKIDFKVEEWGKDEIADFFELIGSDQLKKFTDSYNYAIQDVKPKMANGNKLIRGEKKKAFALTIEEENCIGLTGSVKGIDRKSNFNSLIRKVDDNEAKKELSNSGGTWGKGSSIFIYSSELWMWFCYTLLSKPDNTDDGIFQKKRFIGKSILSPFYLKDTDTAYWGDGWYCKPETDAFPYINEEADSYAEYFGLERRKTEPGTTFFIPFFNPFLDEAKKESVIHEFHNQILKNWYIPIFNNELIINISDSKEVIYSINKLYLNKIPQLKFKLEILNWYSSGCPPDEKFIRETYDVEIPALKVDYVSEHNEFAADKKKAKIDLIIRKIDEYENFDDEWNTVNKVALTRNKGMLIADHEPFDLKSIRTESILFGGLLCNSEPNLQRKRQLDLFLAYSENPAHNKWCTKSQEYNNCFLDYFEGKRPAPEYYINRIFDEIYKSFKKLLDQEIKPETSKDICSIFKKIARLRITGEISGGPRLFSLRTPSDTTNPKIDSNGKFTFRYIIKSNSDEREIELTFRSTLNSLEGDLSSDFDILGIPEFRSLEIVSDSGMIISSGESPKLKLAPKEELIVSIKTCRIYGNKIFKNLEPLIKVTAN